VRSLLDAALPLERDLGVVRTTGPNGTPKYFNFLVDAIALHVGGDYSLGRARNFQIWLREVWSTGGRKGMRMVDGKVKLICGS
jgi:hypothetical protein